MATAMFRFEECCEITPNVKRICIEVKKQEEAWKSFKVFTPKCYRIRKEETTTTYLVKVMVGVDSYIHAMIRALANGTLILLGAQYSKTVGDPLEPF